MQKLKKLKTKLINKLEFKELNTEILKLINKVKFDENNIKGEIFLNLENYNNAFKYFKEKKNYFKCGLIKQKEKQYEEVFNCFNESKIILK